MTVAEAYEHGKKAFEDGADINHVPGHYSSIEIENFQAGYSEAQQEAMAEMFSHDDDDFDFEDMSLYPDSTDED